MSPGMMTSKSRGGFQHGSRQQHFAATPTSAPRIFAASRPKFAVSPNDSGGSNISLTPDKTVTIGVDADGAVTITVGPKPAENANGNGLGQRSMRRGLPGGSVDKMAVSTSNDGSVVVRPEGDAVLRIVGDPLSGAITVVEIEPEPLNVTP